MSLAGPVATLWVMDIWAPFRHRTSIQTHSVLAAARGYPSPFSALFNDGELLDLIALGLIGAFSASSGSSGGISESCSNVQPSPRIFFHFSWTLRRTSSPVALASSFESCPVCRSWMFRLRCLFVNIFRLYLAGSPRGCGYSRTVSTMKG